MLVWVDCTAAAHPLVLRPIIERLEARGHEVFVTAREYGQTLGHPRAARHPLYGSVGEPRRGLGGWARGGRSAGRSARLGAAGLGAAPAPGDRATARSTSPSSRRSSASPRRRCRTTSSPAGSARSPSGSRSRVLVPDSIPLERLAKIGAKEREAGSLPGPEGGVLPGRLRARSRRARRARARPREGAGRRPPAAGDLRVPRPQRPLRRGDPPPRRAPASAQAVVIPRTEAPGRRGARRSAPPT